MATRKIEYNDQTYFFNFSTFKEIFKKEKIKRKITFQKLEEDVSESLNLSKDAIHNWRTEKNGPSDIYIIEELAKELKLDGPMLLLTKNGGKKSNILNSLQIDSIKRIYDSIIEYLDEFENTDGFNDLWCELNEKPEFREDKLYEIVEKRMDSLNLVLKKEYIFLKNTKIYDELKNFEYNDLYDTFDGKLSYAYRFEAIPSGNPTTEEDYYKALNNLNSIIDKYIQ